MEEVEEVRGCQSRPQLRKEDIEGEGLALITQIKVDFTFKGDITDPLKVLLECSLDVFDRLREALE
jgi:hypothetical protein